MPHRDLLRPFGDAQQELVRRIVRRLRRGRRIGRGQVRGGGEGREPGGVGAGFAPRQVRPQQGDAAFEDGGATEGVPTRGEAQRVRSGGHGVGGMFDGGPSGRGRAAVGVVGAGRVHEIIVRPRRPGREGRRGEEQRAAKRGGHRGEHHGGVVRFGSGGRGPPGRPSMGRTAPPPPASPARRPRHRSAGGATGAGASAGSAAPAASLTRSSIAEAARGRGSRRPPPRGCRRRL